MRRGPMEYIESKQLRKDVAEFRTGDTVRVHWKVKEGEKERVQPFEGVVIRKTKGDIRATFTVRKISYGVGVERIFPLHSPRYEKIEVLSHGDVRRNRLFFLRNRKGKASRVEAQEETGELPTRAGSAALEAARSAASNPPGASGDSGQAAPGTSAPVEPAAGKASPGKSDSSKGRSKGSKASASATE